ncbi:hypothetical protein BKA00_007080 [Actinomadura coerulea]|uniref:NlpC/P60 domain-containing protein n=1 Tax=Actinomadura coerulea TaxID=46159 RepID=A0A7X0G8C3_9ACTN|nr:hypothetical protein [Actinomadura coerulea]MBB6400166.1 hypothetical protein [Actinomadura coerulea]
MDEDSSPWKGSEVSPRPLDGDELQDGPSPAPQPTALQPVVDGEPPEDLAELAPEEIAALGSDPRIAAAAQQPQNVSDILKEQSAIDRGADGTGTNPYGDAALRGGPVQLNKDNPLGMQRALDVAAKAAQLAKDLKAPPTGTGTPSEQTPQSDPREGLKRAAGDFAEGKLREAAAKKGLPANYVPSIPEGDNLGEKGLNLLGQAADIGARALADRYAPKAYDTVKDSGAGGRALDKFEQSKLGQKIPKSFMDGFRRRRGGAPNTAGAGQKGKNERADGKKSEKDKQNGKLKLLLAASLPILIPLLCIILIAGMILGVNVDDDVPESQPEQTSDNKIAEYFPGNWQRILKQASEQTSGSAQDYSEVPWTILAGLAKAQTDFARYSPYDNIDRDPGRKAKEVPGGDGSGGDGSTGGVDVNASNTVGAGPGPVQGVSGPGSAATVPGTDNGHVAPPEGDFSHQFGWFLWALRMQESNGVYDRNAGTNKSTACGAYQYITSTWNNYGGYARACLAPPSVQDRRVKEDILRKWNKYHKWQPIAVDHFTGSWGPNPEKWDQCPGACDFNPTAWKYVDGVMTKMRAAAQAHPAGSGAAQPASYHVQPGGPRTQTAALRAGAGAGAAGQSAGLRAWGCDVEDPDPDIGGKDNQGSGPYLLTPAASGQMRMHGLDPQNPCQSSYFVAFELVKAAEKVHRDPKSPRWKPDGNEKDQENARKYWSKVIAASGIFMERTANPDGPCAVPPPDDPEKPWSVSFKIISIWRCETNRLQNLYLVTGGKYQEGGFKYSVQDNRPAAVETLVNEAMSVSYGAGKWKTDDCDNGKDSRQGIFPMTKKEAEEAGVEDRCDVDKNIAGAAKLVLSVEKVPPEERPHDLGVFQPMVGGWQKLSIAMGTDLELFSLIGPGQNTFQGSDECTAVMRKFLTDIAPYANEFASLKKPPGTDKVYSEWQPKLQKLEEAHGITDPASDPKCMIGSWAPGYNATLAQIATGLTGGANSTNLDGLGNYYQGREDANTETSPVVGEDTLVIPRLALRPLKPVGAPVGEDAAEAWSRLGNTEGVLLPLEQVAVEYAWFFGGVITPFNSAGKLIGSLATGGGAIENAGTTQTTVGPDGCPVKVGTRALHDGVVNKATNPDQITIHKLCVDSVAKARTPQAAMAIKWALNHLNWPYAPLTSGKRNDPGWADCSSFVSRAYRDSGAIPNLYPKGSNAPVTGTFRVVRWMHRINYSQAKPGDLVEPSTGHVAMQLADGYKVHTNRTGDVSKVERAYTTGEIGSDGWVGWVDASKV